MIHFLISHSINLYCQTERGREAWAGETAREGRSSGRQEEREGNACKKKEEEKERIHRKPSDTSPCEEKFSGEDEPL